MKGGRNKKVTHWLFLLVRHAQLLRTEPTGVTLSTTPPVGQGARAFHSAAQDKMDVHSVDLRLASSYSTKTGEDQRELLQKREDGKPKTPGVREEREGGSSRTPLGSPRQRPFYEL